MRIQTGHGTKGTREYDWAWLDVRPDDTLDGYDENGTSVLVARRHRYTSEPSFFRCWTPGKSSPCSTSRITPSLAFLRDTSPYGGGRLPDLAHTEPHRAQ
ncbi:hypothetical protein ACH4B2_27040 [Streptomyces antibioticus]|uniref:hypothetical protein n=1 Tax=Streptomyces antibioticus TaxID=1890 RepID=UPI00225B5F31|nr:hypothetical protein [Streptomyces antibioticus]MCX5169744.1 hypothetical protein [Streptomyces antibioticus]